jgi:AhpD family alkylhydroperoxidase
MKTFKVPTREDVSPANQALFDNLNKAIGKVPNLYAEMAVSSHGLGNYLALSNAKTSLRPKEKEAVNLVVSEANSCEYCLSAHTAVAKLNGYTDEQILELRGGSASFDAKLDALVKYAKSGVETRGHVSDEVLDAFFAAGWTEENLMDAILVIGDKTITNYLYAATKVPVDWPAVPKLKAQLA